ncbi:MAG: ribosome biogenesis protein [Desulfurococcales archaeon ex4484_204]|nr:MAG: ribosome biogenesis protein [Desulfurococcales archaeon ex4484_204]
MKFLLRKCPKCGTYTLREKCPKCGQLTRVAHPHRFSPHDKYVKYRVLMKG